MQARRVVILQLLSGFLGIADRLTDASLASFVSASADCSIEALRAACNEFAGGEVAGWDSAYPPNAPQIAARAKFWDQLLKRLEAPAVPELGALKVYAIGAPVPEGHEPLGPIRVNFGGRDISLAGLRHDQKEAILRNKGLPPAAPDATKPRLQKMRDK